MAACFLAYHLNIHKKHKYLKTQKDDGGRIAPNSAEVPEAEIDELAEALRSPSPVGRALRVLIGRIQRPQTAYSDEDLRQLLLLSLAELQNERRK